MTRTRQALCTLALLAAMAAPAGAQEITGSITGVVRDAQGGVLPGVTVTATHTTRATTTEVVTSETGVYTLPFMPIGTYDVTFSLAGFQTSAIRGIKLSVNDRLEVPATLQVGALTDTVEVVGGLSTLLQYTPQVQNLMGATQLQELPLNNRNFAQLASLIPGVNSSLPDEVGIGLTSVVSLSMAGNRRNAVNWLVDGASNVDVGSNITLLSTPTLESIEEFRIITTGYNAEWPRSGGGIVNVVTKSGSNVFRASGYEFYRNDSLNANSFFRNQSTDPETSGKAPELSYNNFGYTLGGPALRDRLFFFVSQEWRQISRAPTDASATTIDPTWLNDPTNPNYVPPAERDPNAVRLLAAWPAVNLGAATYQERRPSDQDTRQEVIRMDWQLNNRWRLMSRYTHDLSMTTEVGGLFFNTTIPNIATTLTDVPGHVFVTQLTTTIRPNLVNEATFQFSGNAITSEYGSNVVNRRDAFNLTIPELFPENRNSLIPSVTVTGQLTGIGAPQLFDNSYRNYTLTDNLSWQRGNHSYKAGLLMAFEQKDEWAGSGTQGSFVFAAGGGRTAFQNFLRGNADGLCGNPCTYTEPAIEVQSQFRFNRYEFYVQDSWRPRSNVTLDYGLRYALYPPAIDKADILTNFSPDTYDPARAAQMTATGSVVPGTGDPLNGIIVANQNSPHGRGIYQLDKNNFQPRVGFSWDMFEDARTVMRGGYGIYYDQVLIGIFLQNAFVNPPFVSSPQVLNAQLSNPGAGIGPASIPVQNLIATSDPFETPRTQMWNIGVQRQLYSRGMIDIGYVGSAGDNLIQPVDINAPLPQEVMAANGVLNLARPYLGFGGINRRQTTAKSRYNAMLFSFRHDQGRAGLLNVSYTLSRTMTDATNDRDAEDLPQSRLDLDAEYALARTDRTHVLTFNYVYELPFFRDADPLLQSVLGGWQVSGITSMWSGNPVPRIANANTNGSRRGNRVNQVSDPFANLPADVPGGVYYFNPAAFEAPPDGQLGSTGRAPFRAPGVHQWDITLSKNWYAQDAFRIQFRADFINAFNHTQFTGLINTCPSNTTQGCILAGNRFGQLTGTRSPREIQLGVRVSWR